jgi:hypothetical protein
MNTETMTSTPAFFSRLCWMIVGPFALAICALAISDRPDGWLGLLDVLYFLVLTGTIVARGMEFRCGRPMTATGEPATIKDLHRYALALGVLGCSVWIAANLLGNHVVRVLG